MPRTKAGEKTMRAMKKQYGAKKGEDVYYASIVKGKPGTSKLEGRGGTGKLAKARRTYKRTHKKK